MAAVACGLTAFVLWRIFSPASMANSRSVAAERSAASTARRPTHGSDRRIPGFAQGVPTFTRSQSGQPAIQDVPGAPGYDPTNFSGLVSMSKVFEAEPRDEQWAGRIEAWISARLVEDLRSIAPLVKATVECRTTACRWRWSAPQEAQPNTEEVMRWVQRTLYMGSITENTGRDEITTAYFGGGRGFTGLQMGDAAALIERLKHRRASILRSIHEGRRSHLDAHIPRAAWPKL